MDTFINCKLVVAGAPPPPLVLQNLLVPAIRDSIGSSK